MTAHIDSLRTDAKDADAPKPTLRVHDAGRHGRRQSGRHGDGDDVQRFDDDGFGWNLKRKKDFYRGTNPEASLRDSTTNETSTCEVTLFMTLRMTV